MRLISLSRYSTRRQPTDRLTSLIIDPSLSLARPVRIALDLLSLFSLGAALALSIFVILLPSETLHLSALTIHPSGKSIDLPALSPIFGLNLTEFLNTTESQGSSGPVGGVELIQLHGYQNGGDGSKHRDARDVKAVEPMGSNRTHTRVWLGNDGPSIWIGAMLICSRNTSKGDISCTSSSGIANHTALLPLALRPALDTLPKSPISPMLLVISGLATLVATFIHVLSLIPCTRLLRLIPRPYQRHRVFSDQEQGSDSDSMIILVNPEMGTIHADAKKGKKGSRLLSAVMLLTAFAFGVAATIVEALTIRRVWYNWDEAAAKSVGLQIDVGVLLYLLPCIALLLLLTMVTECVPFIHDLVTNLQWGDVNIQRTAIESGVSDTMPVKPSSATSVVSGNVAIVKTPEEAWSRVSLERPREGISMETLEWEGKASTDVRVGWRDSWRKSLGGSRNVGITM